MRNRSVQDIDHEALGPVQWAGRYRQRHGYPDMRQGCYRQNSRSDWHLRRRRWRGRRLED
jgi:hypothetical protein